DGQEQLLPQRERALLHRGALHRRGWKHLQLRPATWRILAGPNSPRRPPGTLGGAARRRKGRSRPVVSSLSGPGLLDAYSLGRGCAFLRRKRTTERANRISSLLGSSR